MGAWKLPVYCAQKRQLIPLMTLLWLWSQQFSWIQIQLTRKNFCRVLLLLVVFAPILTSVAGESSAWSAFSQLYFVFKLSFVCAFPFYIQYWVFSYSTLVVGRQEGHPACKKTEWWGAGVVISLERGADLHMAQLMPLPLTVSCFSKIQIGFYHAMLYIRGTSHGPISVRRLSITSWSSTTMAKHRIIKTTPGTLVFWCQRSLRSSTGVTPYEGA